MRGSAFERVEAAAIGALDGDPLPVEVEHVERGAAVRDEEVAGRAVPHLRQVDPRRHAARCSPKQAVDTILGLDERRSRSVHLRPDQTLEQQTERTVDGSAPYRQEDDRAAGDQAPGAQARRPLQDREQAAILQRQERDEIGQVRVVTNAIVEPHQRPAAVPARIPEVGVAAARGSVLRVL